MSRAVWALQTALAASPMCHKLVATHRISVHRKAVPRTHLQRPQSWSAKTNNAYNRKHNVYNSTWTLPQAAFHSVCLPSSRSSWAGILHRHFSVIPPCLGQELLSAPSHFPGAISKLGGYYIRLKHLSCIIHIKTLLKHIKTLLYGTSGRTMSY